ncbi:MAG: helix-turn-helix domain-containing protein [Lentisphaerae bacterium]|nr:helix-turn-helix domain-containing protein [Lentisphaerota bacterium]
MRQTLQAKSFFFDRMLPVRIIYTRHSEAADWHSHEFSEIAIILNGSAVYETDFCTSSVQAGDVLVMPADGVHKFHSEVDIEQYNILFQFEKLPVPSRDITRHPGFSSLFHLNPEYCRQMQYYPRFRIESAQELEQIKTMLNMAYQAQEQKQTGYALTVYGTFLLLIPILLENYQRTVPQSGTVRSPERLADCLDYMKHNFRKPLHNIQLAAVAKMAPASFVRHFRGATGCTPLEYLIRMRLDEASFLLLNSQLSIAEVAQQSGFDDSNYFSRLFRRKNGLSPREYRQQQKSAATDGK